jgi:hypothetical protein
VLFTIPLAIVGVWCFGLLVTGTDISVMVLIGVILLVGVVVNNAIVLIDCVNRLRRAGVEQARSGCARRPHPTASHSDVDAHGGAGPDCPWRFRGAKGSDLRAPLAITVFWGLSVATLLTLVVLPAAYLVVPSRVTVEDAGCSEDSDMTLPEIAIKRHVTMLMIIVSLVVLGTVRSSGCPRVHARRRPAHAVRAPSIIPTRRRRRASVSWFAPAKRLWAR